VRRAWFLVVLLLLPHPVMSQQGLSGPVASPDSSARPRARDIGLVVGVFQPGTNDAITDVSGVLVGQKTVIRGDSVRTGVTAILPHPGNMFFSRVPAAIYVGNGFGKLLGYTQVRELGELETPVLLTCTLCVWKAADAMVGWLLAQPHMEDVRSINPVVGETNDGTLNDIRARPITPEDVVSALESATGGPVAEGAVGAGAGTIAFGWKGGIGTASRVLPESLGGYTVGVLVQTNFGGILLMNGAPVGQELGQYAFKQQVAGGDTGGVGGSAPAGHDPVPYDPAKDPQEWGSCMIVVATDAPLSDRNLERLAKRAIMGLARTGSYASNGSGDYVIAFSTANGVRRAVTPGVHSVDDLNNESMGGLFEATVEATQEAIYNSLLEAVTVTSNGHTIQALPLDKTLAVLKKYGVVR
jgi:D-aminopeptidase